MPQDTMPPPSPTTLSVRAIDDLALGVSKLASGWLKARMDADPNWRAGAFTLDLAAALDNSFELKLGDYRRIAEKAQKQLGVYVSQLHRKAPGVSVDLARGKHTFRISFSDLVSSQD